MTDRNKKSNKKMFLIFCFVFYVRLYEKVIAKKTKDWYVQKVSDKVEDNKLVIWREKGAEVVHWPVNHFHKKCI